MGLGADGPGWLELGFHLGPLQTVCSALSSGAGGLFLLGAKPQHRVWLGEVPPPRPSRSGNGL